jgi:2-phosphoglycerate kinase
MRAGETARETTVCYRDHGLPYSKGLMAQSLSATGLPPERAFDLARQIESRLADREEASIAVAELRTLAEEVVREEEGERAVRRFREWQRIDHLELPLIILIGGTTGTGKSTVAHMLANRLGITRVISTDAIRQVMRSCFTRELMPAVHYSAFEAAEAVEPPGESGGEDIDPDLAGFARQVESVGTGVAAIVERAVEERTPTVVEGIHVLPGGLDPELCHRCVAVEALLVVEEEGVHRGHFSARGGERPAERYLESFDRIRKLQGHLLERARARGVPVIANESVDRAVVETLDCVLEAAGRVTSSPRS